MRTISVFKFVSTRSPTNLYVYNSTYTHAEPDTVEALYDLSDGICDASSEVADQLQRDAEDLL